MKRFTIFAIRRMIFRPNMQHRIYRTAKPFVKWVGGKTQLLGDIERTLPSDFSQKKNVIYVEPFVGGGAVLFWITTYKVIKEQPYKLIEQLKELQEKYIPLGEEDRKEYYLNKRDIYNASSLSEIETAALFIFLNRTCFNGLYQCSPWKICQS